MKKAIILFTFWGSSLFAQSELSSFEERVRETYLRTDKNYSLDCYYASNDQFQIINPTKETIKTNSTLERSFVIETATKKISMDFILRRNGNRYGYEITFDKKNVSFGDLKYREFQINPIANKELSQEIDLPRLNCQVNFAYEQPYQLKDGNYHINVHPHFRYDWMRKLKTITENYFKDKRFESLILLETTNGRGNSVSLNDFFDGVDYRIKQTQMDVVLTDVPDDVPLLVSPAGNSEYIFDVDKELNVTFTGGNHNYCIWNVTRHVILGLLRSNSTAVINFNYDSSAIVAQRRGVEGLGLDFPKKDIGRSNLLKDLLDNKSIIDRYHRNWLWYFQNTLGKRYIGQFKSYTINYKAIGWERTVVVEGNGTRDLIVNINIF